MDALTLLPEFRDFVRVLGDEMDAVLIQSLNAGIAEAIAYLGCPLDGTKHDNLMAVFYLGRSHFDDADADRCRQVARLMLLPSRVNTGMAGA